MYLSGPANQPQRVFGITTPFHIIPFSNHVVFSHNLTVGMYSDTCSYPYIFILCMHVYVSTCMDKEFYHQVETSKLEFFSL